MASFEQFKKVKQRTEGYFARLKNDLGGMTYQGIARNFHQNWPGWPIIDLEIFRTPQATDQQLSERLKNNSYLESLVNDFYRPWWKAIGGDQLSQDLANLYMDWYIHKPADAVRTMQTVLNQSFGESLTVDGKTGPKTRAAVQRHDSTKLYNLYRNARLDSYRLQSASSPTFWQAWVKRVERNFPSKPEAWVFPSAALGLLTLGYLLKKAATGNKKGGVKPAKRLPLSP